MKLRGLKQSGHWPSGNPRFYYRYAKPAVPMPDLPKDHPDFVKAWAAAVAGNGVLP